MSETRHRIRDHVYANAGIHFNELVRASAFAPGQIQYHVGRLVEDGSVVSDRLYGRTHYYPPAYDDWERGVLALFRRETARELLCHLIEDDGARPNDVADDLEVARSTLEWHLDHLCEREVVEKRYDDRNRVTLHLTHPERTGAVLSEVVPAGSDRLVDRFTRLVDQLLEGGDSSELTHGSDP